jgi:hypothetical protein
MRHAATIVIASLLCAAPAFAHSEQAHVMGSVVSVEAERMQVKTMDGESVSIRLNDATRYEDADGNRTEARPTSGQRVVVDVEGPAGEPTATEVRFSSGNAKDDPDDASDRGHQERHEEP